MARFDLEQLRNLQNASTGELVVILQAGRSPVKVSRGRLVEEPGMNLALATALGTQSLAAGVTAGAVMSSLSMAENPLPKFRIRTNSTKNLRVAVMGRQVSTELLENIEYTAMKNMEDDYGRLRNRVAGSIIIKAVASVAAGVAAGEATRKLSKGDNGLASLVGLLVGSGTGVALFATMKPDLRCWHTLPANLQLTRMRLPPGRYTATVQYIGYNGAVRNVKQLNFEVKKKEKYFINIRTVD